MFNGLCLRSTFFSGFWSGLTSSGGGLARRSGDIQGKRKVYRKTENRSAVKESMKRQGSVSKLSLCLSLSVKLKHQEDAQRRNPNQVIWKYLLNAKHKSALGFGFFFFFLTAEFFSCSDLSLSGFVGVDRLWKLCPVSCITCSQQ